MSKPRFWLCPATITDTEHISHANDDDHDHNNREWSNENKEKTINKWNEIRGLK